MFPTPNLSHLTLVDYEKVYEPAEDSFLLLDAIEKDYKLISDRQPRLCLEIGCGSGIGIVFLAQLLGRHALYLATDINASAVRTALRTAIQNGVNLETVQTDLVSGLLPRLLKQVDVLLFNPPYVVTPSEDIKLCESDPLPVSWAGGNRGREVMDRLFPLVKDILSENGIFYLVVIEENDPEEIIELMENFGFEVHIVLTRRSGRELLSILRFTRKKTSV